MQCVGSRLPPRGTDDPPAPPPPQHLPQQCLLAGLSSALHSKPSAAVRAGMAVTRSVSDSPFLMLAEPMSIRGELGGGHEALVLMARESRRADLPSSSTRVRVCTHGLVTAVP